MENTTIDMEQVADLVRAAGYVAYVEQTGGGVATIYASRTADAKGYPTRHPESPYGDDVCDIAAGPGWFEGPGWTNARGDTADFYVGPDGDPDHALIYRATDADTEDTIAGEIIRRLTATPAYRCSGDIPAGHVDCALTFTTIEDAMDHFEQTSHNVDEVCTAVDCDEPYHRATYSDLVCSDCGYEISPLQDVHYDAAAGTVHHSDEAHREMAG